MVKQWKEIALVLRDRQFDETEDLEIDIFDVEVNNLNECFLPIILFRHWSKSLVSHVR